jgi:hypothetical protein
MKKIFNPLVGIVLALTFIASLHLRAKRHS